MNKRKKFNDVVVLMIITVIFLIGILCSRIEAKTDDIRDESINTTPIPTSVSVPSSNVSKPMPTATPKPIKRPVTPTSTPTPTPAYVNTWNCEHECDNEGRFYDIPLLPEYQSFIHECAHSHGVPFNLAIATCWMESRYTPAARHHNDNGTDDAGLFQINECNWETYRKLYGETWDPYDPYDSIKAGIHYISYAMGFDDDPKTYMMVYNMGPTGAKQQWKWGKKSSKYTKELLRYMNEELAQLKIIVD